MNKIFNVNSFLYSSNKTTCVNYTQRQFVWKRINMACRKFAFLSESHVKKNDTIIFDVYLICYKFEQKLSVKLFF